MSCTMYIHDGNAVVCVEHHARRDIVPLLVRQQELEHQLDYAHCVSQNSKYS